MTESPQLDKAKLQKYAELKAEEKRIAAEIDELKPEIQAAIVASGADKVETDFGNFILKPTVRWKYSPAVEALQEEEKAKGIAQKVETPGLLFKAAKVEGNE